MHAGPAYYTQYPSSYECIIIATCIRAAFLTFVCFHCAYRQAVDAYAADTKVCQLPDFLGGTVPEASLCGVGTTIAVAAPDGTSEAAAAHVTLFRYSMDGWVWDR